MFSSIRSRFTFVHFFMILFVAVLIGLMSYRLLVEALERLQKDKLSYVAASEAEHVAESIEAHERLLHRIAMGEVVARYSRSYQDKLLQEYFTRYQDHFHSLTFVNQQGLEELKVVDGVNVTLLEDVSMSQLFEEIVWSKNQVITRIHLPAQPGQAAVLLSGFYRESFFGEFEGIVIAKTLIPDLMQRFQGFQVGANGFLLILDSQGRILAHPDPAKHQHAISANDPDSRQILKRALDMEQGIGRATLLGIDGLVAYTPIRERNWVLFALLPYEEFMFQPMRYRDLFLKLLFLVLTGGLLLSVYLSSRITRPVHRLTELAEEIAQGNLQQRLDVDALDEFGRLFATFNLMADNLQKFKQDLVSESRIRDRLIKELESKYEEMERFTYTVSHDLKSPLVTVKGFIGLLEQDIEDCNQERIERDLEQIGSAADQMASLLEDLLELSRAGHQIRDTQPVPLTDLFTQAIQQLQGSIIKIDADIDLQADMPVVVADRKRMLEVAQNLVENALKFSRPGVRPEVRIHASEDNGYVTCCVEDNGRGIDPRYQDRIFDLFERLHEDTEGTGIGLSLVKRIIEVHNGLITVQSEGEGKGTKFCFTLASEVPKDKIAS